MLAVGALTLTTVQLLARRLTAENADQLLSEAAGRSKLEVQELLARQFPKADVRDSIRRLPGVDAVAPASPVESASAVGSAPLQSTMAPPSRDVPTQEKNRSPAPIPLAPDRYQITFTASAETCALLRQAKEQPSHAVPDGSTDQVVNRALKALLSVRARKQHGLTDRPRTSKGSSTRRSRPIPAAVRRIVWQRDGGRCAFVAASGQRCPERRFIQYHHVDPWALGGEATPDKIELRCRAHNNYEATLWGLGRPATRSGSSSRPTARPTTTEVPVAPSG
jgi:hypothetical protein